MQHGQLGQYAVRCDHAYYGRDPGYHCASETMNRHDGDDGENASDHDRGHRDEKIQQRRLDR